MQFKTSRYLLAGTLLAAGALLLAHDDGNAPHGGKPPLHAQETMRAFQADHHDPEPLAAQSITSCIGGFAGIYPCSNVDLMAFLPLNQIGGGNGNDIWGWTDSLTGKEYAIMGRTTGTSFVDVSDPVNPIYLGTLLLHGTTSSSSWRDIKVFNNYAFVVSEANNSGMQIFDLTLLRSGVSPTGEFTETAWYNGFLKAHNLVINEDSGFAYAVGSNVCSGGLEVININNPLAPVDTGCFSADGYTHDAQCVNYVGPDGDYADAEICLASNTDTLTIVDVTNKVAPTQISRTGYAGRGYTHQGWLTDDHRYFLLDDELDERDFAHNTRTYIWDLLDLDSPILLGNYTGTNTAYDHNQYIKGNLAYQSNYRSGLRILDITNIAAASLNEVAFFDVYPSDDNNGFNGTWSNYPYFDSGIVVVSGIEQGLFILKPNLGGGSNPPTASIVAPLAASTVSGNELIQIDATDDIDALGSLTVEWNIDGGTWQSTLFNGASGYYEATWVTTTSSNGPVTLNARAIDSDLGATNVSIALNIGNTLPTFQIKSIDVESQAVNGPRNRGVATVSLETQNGANLEAVAIVGTCSGDWSGSVNGLTDSTGVVVLQTPPIKNGSSWTFCIDSATTAFATFDPAGPDCGSNVGPSTFGEVAGVVTDSVTAAPIGGATVSADSGQSDTTDAGGNYMLSSVPTGTRAITASAVGYTINQQTANVTDGGVTVVDFSLIPSGSGGVGTIKGTVTNAGGAKLAGVLVGTDTGHMALTNKGGKYMIQNVPAGDRSVTASKAGFTPEVINVTVNAGSTTTVNFTLSP